MAADRNPDHNPIVQALLDLGDAHLGSMTVQQALAKLSSDRKLRADLGNRYAARGYAQADIKYTRLTIDQRLMDLTPAELKVLVFLGFYCTQEGMISVKLRVMSAACKLSENTIRPCIQGLTAKGLITEVSPPARHESAVWQVNPEVISCGKVMQQGARAKRFAEAAGLGAGYILRGDLDLVVSVDTVYRTMPDGDRLYYSSVNLLPADSIKKEPAEAPASPATVPRKRRKSSKPTVSEEQLPGQMVITDFVPDPSAEADELPF